MNTSIIYLLGAGRSGTTLLATVLNSHPKITTIGEMHQFFEYLVYDKKCSCGESLIECSFWSKIINKFRFKKKDLLSYLALTKRKEQHSNILKLLFKRKYDQEYIEIHEQVFKTVQEEVKAEWLLDSSKYIARFLLLKQSKKLKIKGIYVVRDVRGVINSFGKQVQTPKNPLSTILYYSFINFFGQITCWLNKDVLKIRYEDFVSNPQQVSNLIVQHVFETSVGMSLSETFETPHIIGGNRMKVNRSIIIINDKNWKHNISRPKQILFYILSFPLMILNNYKT